MAKNSKFDLLRKGQDTKIFENEISFRAALRNGDIARGTNGINPEMAERLKQSGINYTWDNKTNWECWQCLSCAYCIMTSYQSSVGFADWSHTYIQDPEGTIAPELIAWKKQCR